MRQPKRILVGAASFADARAALRLARLLAARSPAVVGGLLVDEAILNDLPRIGRQRVVTAGGRLHDVPTATQIARMFERDAKAFQSALSEMAGVGGQLVQLRGELTVSAWETGREWDVLICGQRETHGLPGRVVVIAPPVEASSDTVGLANDLARAAGTTAIVLAIVSGSNADETYPTEADLFRRIDRLNCAAVVLDRAAGPIRTAEQLRTLMAAARCPVVVLGEVTEIEPSSSA